MTHIVLVDYLNPSNLPRMCGLFAVILPFLFLRFAVIAPINKLTQAAIKISTGQPADLGIERVSPNTGNEIHHLAFGLERLRTSMQLAIQRMKSTNKPT